MRKMRELLLLLAALSIGIAPYDYLAKADEAPAANCAPRDTALHLLDREGKSLQMFTLEQPLEGGGSKALLAMYASEDMDTWSLVLRNLVTDVNSLCLVAAGANWTAEKESPKYSTWYVGYELPL